MKSGSVYLYDCILVAFNFYCIAIISILLNPLCMQYVQFVIRSFTFPRISITTELPVGIRTYLCACMYAYLSAFLSISASLWLSIYLYIYIYNPLLLEKLIVTRLVKKFSLLNIVGICITMLTAAPSNQRPNSYEPRAHPYALYI